MKGHIRQRSKGSWTLWVDIGRDSETGKRKQQTLTVRGTKRDAERKLRELLHSLEAGSYIKPSRITLGQWLEQWCQSYVAIHCSARTVESYQSEVRRHLTPILGRILLPQLQPQHLENYYSQALIKGRVDGKGGLSARTVQYHHRILSEALSHAVKMGLVARNVAEAVDPPRAERKNLANLAPENVPNFLEAARETPYYALFYTALWTGMRLGELLGLRWCDVDLDMASISVVQALFKRCGVCKMIEPKSSKSRRRISLSPSLALLLRQYKTEQEGQRNLLGEPLVDTSLVFSHSDGKPLDPGVVSHTFAKVLKKARLPHIRFHDLRHSHATLLLKAGIHPKIVSERLGHANIGITLDTYSHVLPGLQERAAQRFDEMLEPRVIVEDVSKMLAKDPSPDSMGR
jgi:integrase